jgi:hypothetical protein
VSDAERRTPLRFVVLSFLLGRGALAAILWMSVAWLPARTPNDNRDFVAFPGHPLWDSLCRWDSGWYDRIARLGYSVSPGAASDVAFFPAFPYLSRWLGPALGGHWAAGLAIGNAALLAGLWFTYRLGELRGGPELARRAVWMVLLYPATVFYSAYYGEGLFLMAATGALYFCARDRLGWAGAMGGLAAMTRPVGVLLFPALLVGALRRGARPIAWTWLGLIPLGLLAVMVTLAVQVGDPFAFLRVEASWGRAAAWPWVTLVRGVLALDARELMDWLDLAATLGLLGVALATARGDSGHAIFALGCVLAALSSGQLRSMERYAASVPAVFLGLARATGRPWVERVVLLLLGALMAVQTARFAGWYWAG